MPKVSVIVPVYNTEKYLSKCLDSLVNQTLEDIEIIVINDGTKDNSVKIIKRYQKKYKDMIKFIDNQNNGIGKTRNIGIEASTGDYITFIDSDDYVDLDMLKTCYQCAVEKELDIVVCDYYKVFESTNKKELVHLKHFDETNLSKKPTLLFKINSSPWNKLYKRSLFNDKNMRFPEHLKYEDLGLIPLLLSKAKKISHIDEPLNYYLIRDMSETTTIDHKVYDIFKILDIINDYYKDKEEYRTSLEYLNIEKIMIYTISQRNQRDIKLRNQFINTAFAYLDDHFPDWLENPYYRNRSVLKKIIESNKSFTKIYCTLYRCFKKVRTN